MLPDVRSWVVMGYAGACSKVWEKVMPRKKPWELKEGAQNPRPSLASLFQAPISTAWCVVKDG